MVALHSPLIASVNHVLRQSAWAKERLRPFAGKHVRLVLPPLLINCVIDAEGEFLPGESDAAPDVEIALPADAPLLVLWGKERVHQAVQMSGSAEFAEALGFVARNLRWDVEEDLAKVMGDIAAHRVVKTLEAMAAWRQQATTNLAENFSEYFSEERSALVTRDELTALTAEVEPLEAAIARLEQRIKRLG
jgi:ubiquinone biosynthesis accessory factor UbiJ